MLAHDVRPKLAGYLAELPTVGHRCPDVRRSFLNTLFISPGSLPEIFADPAPGLALSVLTDRGGQLTWT